LENGQAFVAHPAIKLVTNAQGVAQWMIGSGDYKFSCQSR
jgi:hypothetical protein